MAVDCRLAAKRRFSDPGYDYGSRLPGGPREIHGFVLRKPSEIHDALVAVRLVTPGAFRSPEPVSAEELRFVRSERVVQGLSQTEPHAPYRCSRHAMPARYRCEPML